MVWRNEVWAEDTFKIINIFLFIWGQFWPPDIVVASVCLSVRPPVCHSRACPCDMIHENLWPVPTGITKFGPGVPNTSVKIPVVWGLIDLALQRQIYTLKSEFCYVGFVHQIKYTKIIVNTKNNFDLLQFFEGEFLLLFKAWWHFF